MKDQTTQAGWLAAQGLVSFKRSQFWRFTLDRAHWKVGTLSWTLSARIFGRDFSIGTTGKA